MSDEDQPVDDPRRRRLLDAAQAVFGRYGFRKTSMEEIARAADISRQALYQRFSTKEALLHAALEQLLQTSLNEATASLGDGTRAIDARLVGAFDAWVGRFVGQLRGDASDLMEVSAAVAGPMLGAYEARFLDAVVKSVRGAGLVAAYQLPGLTARQLATTLYATARGLKYACKTRSEFVAELALAARVMCSPARESAR